MNTDLQQRCTWPASDELMTIYHDTQWGVPVKTDQTFFEFLLLDAMQAGLSWKTILYRRETLCSAFAHFQAEKVALFGHDDVERLLLDPGIIRNRAKVVAAIRNAQEFLKIQQEFGSFSTYIWQFVEGKPVVNAWLSESDIPTSSLHSEAMSKDLKSRGFTFVGPTICYAFMQAAGMVNDHVVGCFRYAECNSKAPL